MRDKYAKQVFRVVAVIVERIGVGTDLCTHRVGECAFIANCLDTVEIDLQRCDADSLNGTRVDIGLVEVCNTGIIANCGIGLDNIADQRSGPRFGKVIDDRKA